MTTQGYSSDEHNFRVAIIGAGYMAQEHIRAFANLPQIEIAGIYSRTCGKAETVATQHGITRVCGSIAELYRKTQAHLVVIAVSELSVRGVCLQAFKYPWICLIEKPAGYNLADAEAIAQAARESGHTAYVALNRRHYGSTRAVMAELEHANGQRLVHVYDQEDPRAALQAGRPEQVVRNWMYANSIHVVDFLRIFGRGEIVAVEPVIAWQPTEPQCVLAKISFASGDIGIYEAIWNGPSPWAVTVTTREKRWEMRPLEQASFQVYGSRRLEALPGNPWDTEFKPGLRLQAEEALKVIKGLPSMLPTLGDALETMKLVRDIYEL